MRRAFVSTAAVLLVTTLAFLFLPSVGNISAPALSYSVTRELDAAVVFSSHGCRRTKAGHLRCYVEDDGGSGTVPYRVTMGGRCWDAKRLPGYKGGEGSREHGAGCVRLRDQLRIGERLWDLLEWFLG